MKAIQRALAVSAFVATTLVVQGAMAANPTPIEQAEIGMLSPALQAEVKTRMAASGQKVSEILDTMLLNSVSKIFASGRIVAADFNHGVVVTQGSKRGVAVLQLRSGDSDYEGVALQPIRVCLRLCLSTVLASEAKQSPASIVVVTPGDCSHHPDVLSTASDLDAVSECVRRRRRSWDTAIGLAALPRRPHRRPCYAAAK